MDGITNKYIEKSIEDIAGSLGIKEPVDDCELITLVRSKKIKECIQGIARYLGLPIEIILSYVPKGYRSDRKNNFQSSHLSRTDAEGRGIEGITAQVSIPNNLPMFGTARLEKFPISVKVSENCTENISTFITVMAHELSHVVLHSLRHPEKDNEVYTDVTAMLLGFANVMNRGRKDVATTTEGNSTKTRTTTYGYLSDEQFSFAFGKIQGVLNAWKTKKNGVIGKLDKMNKGIDNLKKTLIHFKKFLANLDINLNRKIGPLDGGSISAFHQVGYLDEIRLIVKEADDTSKGISSFVRGMNHYFSSFDGQFDEHDRKMLAITSKVQMKCKSLGKDVNVLKKYTSICYKMKVFFERLELKSGWIE
jgi:hypothetical protein